ncbi:MULTISPECIES: PspC domain-containing protein [Shewanella]|jgi:phage shock protein PspC (stress-responsive transcriptional regulator)|uniref:Phage shock protein C n=3 Tax=Shewanella TaxID=22 RepID=A0A1S2AIF2_9GAMM|nr:MULTISPECIES: PspC domain-containing protein [Shewanella]AXQ14642.1 hypothetical protein BS332_10405 [Shewanella algae]EKT4486475.1 PspC domain-containing protein [Shewanella algae]MBC8794511.1 PspC domain-containing protein [Shewanella algae]MBO2549705.1 PspC domain-containing protein [Shewanella algae]MBO2551012.1 PspC domain-containing protein [Shewanella algae]
MFDLERTLKGNSSIVCGLCRDMAERFGWSVFWTRIVAAVITLMHPLLGLTAYFALALLWPKWVK